MRKSKRLQLDESQLTRIVEMALEERNPFQVIKVEFGISENEVIDILKKRLPKERFEDWRKLVTAKKPKLTKPNNIDDLDDDLDGKYYIPKNKIL
jgi:uncharacterized protein (TIGR03643 family)